MLVLLNRPQRLQQHNVTQRDTHRSGRDLKSLQGVTKELQRREQQTLDIKRPRKVAN